MFQSPGVDYRMVALGAVLPLAEVLAGRVLILHTLAGAIVTLTVVMFSTVGRRLVRRRWLGLPIGLLVHLVLDGSFSDPSTFWWPLRGFDLAGQGPPELDRGLGLLLLMEAVGGAVIWWFTTRFELLAPEHRARFLRTGQLPRETVGDRPEPTC
ncbi:MAG: hypothetical protein GY929_10025 [Actinomycetia bacterium]|nr:hypothetical protein [Actinomycetes bacterium]